MKLASYKSTRPGLPGIFNRLVRWWCRGDYSHCELIFKSGVSASSSWLDGGVRFKQIEFNPDHWDVIDIEGDEQEAFSWFFKHQGDGYDLLGLLGFVFPPVRHDKKKWSCAEAIAESLGVQQSWRQHPCLLPITLGERAVK